MNIFSSVVLVSILAVSSVSGFSLISDGSRSRSRSRNRNPVRLYAAASLDYESKICDSIKILNKAVETRTEDPDEVFHALSDLENLMRTKCKEEPASAKEVLKNLNGSWRLVFTTGTAKSQERLGNRINYFPVKAIQSFNTTSEPYAISNGIYFVQGQAAKLGSASGLGSDNNVELTKRGRKAFFNWISADETIATARGGGGGLALWKRIETEEE